MDFYIDDEHRDMARALRETLEARFPREAGHASPAAPEVRASIWQALAVQGLHAVLVPETRNGLGLGWEAAVLCFAELGRRVVPGPFIDTVAVAPVLLEHLGPEVDDLVRAIADGSTRLGVAVPGGLVACPDDLDALLVVRGDRLGLVKRSDVDLAPVPSLDEGMPLAQLSPELRGRGDDLGVLPQHAWERAVQAGALAAAAELVGAAGAMVELTRDYVSQRVQFGRPIGSFQAVAHPLVDAVVQLTFAEPVVHSAAWAFQREQPDAGMAVAHAKVAATAAAERVSRVAFQLHGAIGYTYEYDLHHWMKRVRTLSGLYLTASAGRAYLRERVFATAR